MRVAFGELLAMKISQVSFRNQFLRHIHPINSRNVRQGTGKGKDVSDKNRAHRLCQNVDAAKRPGTEPVRDLRDLDAKGNRRPVARLRCGAIGPR